MADTLAAPPQPTAKAQDKATAEVFDFTVEPAPVEVVETIDDSVLAGMLAARCN